MECPSLRSHIVDSRFFSRGYATDEARQVFCDMRRMQRWLDVEAALAASQAELGIIPQKAADELVRTAMIKLLDLAAIRQGLAATGHSLVPLLDVWKEVAGPEAGGYIHFGATTQDIQDTAQALEIRDVLSIIDRDARLIIKELVRLAGRYRDLVMIGRTHGQHALPITLGLKFAVWLDEMLRNLERLRECRGRLLVGQLFGGVGTMAAFGEKGFELLAAFCGRLGLAQPLAPWHTARDRVAELLSFMAMLAGCLAKIANEIYQLARDEIGELAEPFEFGKISSSTMPHKRNPENCEQVVVLARLIKAQAGLGLESLVSEHERDYRAVRLEWVTVAESSLLMCNALDLTKGILQGLIVDEHKIRRNTEEAAAALCSEALMFFLGEHVGKQEAYRLIYEASLKTRVSGQSLLDELMAAPEVSGRFDREILAPLLSPANYTGLAGRLTDRVLQKANSLPSPLAQPDPGELRCPLADDCPA